MWFACFFLGFIVGLGVILASVFVGFIIGQDSTHESDKS